MDKFEDLYRAMQDFEDAIDDNPEFLGSLSVREKMFADRVAILAKRLAQKIVFDNE